MTYRDPAYTNGYEFAQGSGYDLPHYPFSLPPELEPGGRPGHYPVVVVGAGLTGLTLACRLAQLGVPAVVLDEDDTVGVKGASSRGICYTNKSLEIFDRIGIFERIQARGIEWHVGRTFAGNDEVYAFDLKTRNDFRLSQQPAFINIQQFYIEGFLVERLNELGGVDMRWRSRVTKLARNAEHGAELEIQTPQGNYTLRADMVVDATGSHTPFHAWCQVPMTQVKRDDRWCIADVRFSHRPPTERHTWLEAPFNDNRAVWQHLMADDVWRIDYQMAPDADPEYVARQDVLHERLTRQFGADVQYETVWVGPYSYRSQCVERMRVGSVFFAGDTAKLVSPFGARGGNTGIADADNLAWKIAAVVHQAAPRTLLQSYHHERHEAARTNVRVTARTTRFLRPHDPAEWLFRQAVVSLAKQHPLGRALVNTGRMAEANPYTQSPLCDPHQPHAGTTVQNVALRWANGQAGSLNQLLQWAAHRPLLLWFGALDPRQAAALRRLGQRHGVVSVQVLPNAQRNACRELVLDPQHQLRQACHAEHADWALLRPDAYLSATGHGSGQALAIAMARVLLASSTTQTLTARS
ncbi:MAG: FAD-dependent monooxygenase [Proteobacteria bacterium]|nr:FAD-dependent monooxygenase [Pseudomonadota bacterium]MDA1327623.1 FAD-dependent monooxygenase [Pseudomonadota bacterium]